MSPLGKQETVIFVTCVQPYWIIQTNAKKILQKAELSYFGKII